MASYLTAPSKFSRRNISRPSPANPLTQITKQEINIKYQALLDSLPHGHIEASEISILTEDDIENLAVVDVTNGKFEGFCSVNDARLGPTTANTVCPTCNSLACPGHYGSINLPVPVYNPIYIRDIVNILTCVCNNCGELLISPTSRRYKEIMRMGFTKRLGEIAKACKGAQCLRQKSQDEKERVLSCSKNPIFITSDLKDKGVISFRLEDSKEVMTMDPSRVLEILSSIPRSSIQYLGFTGNNHPKDLILKKILVIPTIARPPLVDESRANMDVLTCLYAKIAAASHNSSAVAKDTASVHKTLYELIKDLVIKSDTAKIRNRDVISIFHRIQGKDSLMRRSAMGKTVNMCARTVAQGDPSVPYGYISIPKSWTKVLVKSIAVTQENIETIKRMMADGLITHIKPKRTNLRTTYNPKFSYNINVGDIVSRQLQYGDLVKVNRQPTLHRYSTMAYRVIPRDQDTIGLHLSYTTPMNCDFDGDENNIWNPDDFSVVAEMSELLSVTKNMMSAEQSSPSMGMVMNSVTAFYLLSDPNMRVDNTLFQLLIDNYSNKSDVQTLLSRLRQFNIHPRSGQALISSLLPANFYYENSDVLIIKGVLVAGRLRSKHVGVAPRSIIQEMYKRYGEDRTVQFFTDAPICMNKWIMEHGFSVGLSDFTSTEIDPETGEETNKNERLLAEELAKVYLKIDALGPKSDDPFQEQNRQRLKRGYLNVALTIGIKLADTTLGEDNSVYIMTNKGAGTKGKTTNIGQMMGSVGQQYYRGDILGNTLTMTINNGRRLIPTFGVNNTSPESQAFIPESYYKGLNSDGLFFLQAGGREGLLDTALSTQQTGTIQRLLTKATENIVKANDGSIRNTVGTLFMPLFEGGYDPAEMVHTGNNVNFIDLFSTVDELNKKRGWIKNRNFKQLPAPVDPQVYQNDPILPDAEPEFIEDDIDDELPITTDKLSKFERARLIGARADQLANNAPPLIKLNDGEETDFTAIANREYRSGALGKSLYIIRKYNDGSIEKVYPTLDRI